MKKTFTKIVGGTILFGSVLISGCQEQEVLSETEKTQKDRSAASAKTMGLTSFDQTELATRIENYMKSKVAGFGYSIINSGEEFYLNNGGDGFARKLFETNPTTHGAKARQEIVRATEYVTALAVLKLLEIYGIPYDYTIYSYLPTEWVPTNKVLSLTFEDLLAHKSVLEDYTPPQSLKKAVEDSYFDKGSYRNKEADYKLLALLVARVHAINQYHQGKPSLLNTFKSKTNYDDYCAFASTVFRDFVRTKVFAPAGIEHANLIDWKAWDQNGPQNAANATKGYPAKQGSQAGLLKEDNTLKDLDCGTKGLYISASQLAKLQYAVSKFKVLQGQASINLMKDKLIGYDGKLTGTQGTYYWKKGNGKNCEAIVFDFGKIQVSVFANSPESDISNPTVLANMFEQSIQPIGLKN